MHTSHGGGGTGRAGVSPAVRGRGGGRGGFAAARLNVAERDARRLRAGTPALRFASHTHCHGGRGTWRAGVSPAVSARLARSRSSTWRNASRAIAVAELAGA